MVSPELATTANISLPEVITLKSPPAVTVPDMVVAPSTWRSSDSVAAPVTVSVLDKVVGPDALRYPVASVLPV